MIAGMTIRQLRELEHFYLYEPFGEFRQELRHGDQMALTANINRDPEKRPDPYKNKDFMNYLEPEPEKIYSAEELEAYADKVFRSGMG